MKKLLVASIGALMLTNVVIADDKKEIRYHGQNGETFELTKDNIKAEVELSFKDAAQSNFNLGLGFRVENNGDVTEQIATNTGTNLLVLREKEISISKHGEKIQSDAKYNITIHDRESALKPIDQEIKVTDLNEFYLSFILGQTHLASIVRLTLKDGDKTLVSKNLEAKDIDLSPQSYGDFISVKLKEIGVNVKKGQEIQAEISVAVIAPGAINLDKDKLEKIQEFKNLIVE